MVQPARVGGVDSVAYAHRQVTTPVAAAAVAEKVIVRPSRVDRPGTPADPSITLSQLTVTPSPIQGIDDVIPSGDGEIGPRFPRRLWDH